MDRGNTTRKAFVGALISAAFVGALASPVEARTQRHRGDTQEDQAVRPVASGDRQVLNGDRTISPSRFDRPRNAPASAEDRNICVQEAIKAEVRYGIPHGLYVAVLLKESQYSYGGKTFPHPWTINYKGTDYYYATKEAMISGLKEMREAGVDNLDAGCAQRNLYWHPVAVGTPLEDIVDPARNVDWGVRWFATLYRGGVEEWSNTGNGRLVHNERVSGAGSWPEAVARYHAWFAEHGMAYAQSVYPIWQRTANLHQNERQAALKEMGLDKTKKDRKGRETTVAASTLTPADFAGGFGGGRTQVADATTPSHSQRAPQTDSATSTSQRQRAQTTGRTQTAHTQAKDEPPAPASGSASSPYLVVEAGRMTSNSAGAAPTSAVAETSRSAPVSGQDIRSMFYQAGHVAEGPSVVAALD